MSGLVLDFIEKLECTMLQMIASLSEPGGRCNDRISLPSAGVLYNKSFVVSFTVTTWRRRKSIVYSRKMSGRAGKERCACGLFT